MVLVEHNSFNMVQELGYENYSMFTPRQSNYGYNVNSSFFGYPPQPGCGVQDYGQLHDSTMTLQPTGSVNTASWPGVYPNPTGTPAVRPPSVEEGWQTEGFTNSQPPPITSQNSSPTYSYRPMGGSMPADVTGYGQSHQSPVSSPTSIPNFVHTPSPPSMPHQPSVSTNRQAHRPPYDWMKKQTYTTTPTTGKTRTKDKYRIVYSEYQKVELEKEYLYSKYITIQRKAELARSIGLSERQVKIWFQNRRAKERKQKRKREETVTSATPNSPDLSDLKADHMAAAGISPEHSLIKNEVHDIHIAGHTSSLLHH